MVDILHLQTGLTAQKPVVGVNRLGLEHAPTLHLNILVKIVPRMDLTMRKGNATLKNAQVSKRCRNEVSGILTLKCQLSPPRNPQGHGGERCLNSKVGPL